MHSFERPEPATPSTVSPPYASTRVLSNVARSKTSSSILLQGTQRGDRNQGGESGCELGDEFLVDKFIESCAHERPLRSTGFSQTPQIECENFKTKGSLPLYATSRVPQAYTTYCTTYRTQKKRNGTFSSRFSSASHLPEQLGFSPRFYEGLPGFSLGFRFVSRDITLVVV